MQISRVALRVTGCLGPRLVLVSIRDGGPVKNVLNSACEEPPTDPVADSEQVPLATEAKTLLKDSAHNVNAPAEDPELKPGGPVICSQTQRDTID